MSQEREKQQLIAEQLSQEKDRTRTLQAENKDTVEQLRRTEVAYEQQVEPLSISSAAIRTISL